ncbi:hypothetical protein [Pseudobdellovibrio sp. HCB154]|uniref:hypothetical protein n=1 Tax=Pseudobdellovibrio sp. HCB154 TaxID=3386277 RepID=UPI003916D20B
MRTYKILLIEDNPFVLQVWRAILAQALWSHKLDWATSEKAATKFLGKSDYDIIISDFPLTKKTHQEHCSYILTYTDKAPSIVGSEDQPHYFLQKPLNMAKGMQLIHQLVTAEENYDAL